MAKKATPAAAGTDAGPGKGERIAKVLSRRGIASRREAERLIELGEVAVNGRVIDSPALNVTDADRITVGGKPLPEKEPARLWLYYKPEGLVTTASDEKGRDTVFDHLPEDMPRVMSVGRLDLNSEGLLLLTNDGELKRRLELPSTGWLRKYRVRVNGNPTDAQLDPLRKGIVVEGERFQPMQVTLDRIQGANAWLTVGLREGKNREIRRAMAAVDLYVNRLIRVSYGPFRLNELQPGEVEEIKGRVLRDQLGERPDTAGGTAGEDAPAPKRRLAPRKGAPAQGDAPRKAPAGDRAGKPAPSRRAAGGDDGIAALGKAWDRATRAPRPAGRAAPDATAKPTAKPAAKPASAPAGRTATKSAPKSAERPARTGDARPAAKTAAAKPAAKSASRSPAKAAPGKAARVESKAAPKPGPRTAATRRPKAGSKPGPKSGPKGAPRRPG